MARLDIAFASLLSGGAALAACSSTLPEDGSGAEAGGAPPPLVVEQSPRASAGADPVIAELRLRDESMLIHAGANGPRFTVVGRDGTVLSRNLDEAALAARHEELFRIYLTGYARGGPFLDARIDPRGSADDGDR